MTGRFDAPGNKFDITKDGRTVFDTSARPPFTIPDNALIVSNYNVVYPNFQMGIFYKQYRQTFTVPPGGPTDYYGCFTLAAIADQEWNNAAASPFNLPDVTLGNVPSDVNYLETWANLTWTVQPDTLMGDALVQPISFMRQGGDVLLSGGSCLVEIGGGIYRRLFTVLLGSDNGNGTRKVIISRKQSVINANPAARTAPTGGGTGNDAYYFSGTAGYSTTGGFGYGKKIDHQGINQIGGGNHRPARYGGSSPCSESLSAISYASTWQADFTIIPGRVEP